MNLLEAFIDISQGLSVLFVQQRTFLRAQRLLLSNLLCIGKHWITRWLSSTGRDQRDWSADYKLFARSRWEAHKLFDGVITESLSYTPKAHPVVVALDETKVKRAGRKVKRSCWTRDPLSPPFHVNFIKAIRYLHLSMLLPLYRGAQVSARSIPIGLHPIDHLKRPGKKAKAKEKAMYRKLSRTRSMSHQAALYLEQLRETFDRLGARSRELLVVGDGSFCNQVLFKRKFERLHLLARCRKDAKLCFRSRDPAHPRRFFAEEKMTPESIGQDSSQRWCRRTFMIGGKKRKVRFKELKEVYWQRGAGKNPLRLIVLAPLGYRLSPHGRVHYRAPGYLLTNDLSKPIELLIQSYIDRWEIEVNHRDEKQHIGLGDPQVWNARSVDEVPRFLVACYAMLLLASLKAYGAKRTEVYFTPPRWQRHRSRPSCLDLLSRLRRDAFEHPELIEKLGIYYQSLSCIEKAAA